MVGHRLEERFLSLLSPFVKQYIQELTHTQVEAGAKRKVFPVFHLEEWLALPVMEVWLCV